MQVEQGLDRPPGLEHWWQAGPPAGIRGWSLGIDAEVAGEAECVCCGFEGLAFRPFHCGPRYRAFGACPACHAWAEF
jgi:hypothetical protein